MQTFKRIVFLLPLVAILIGLAGCDDDKDRKRSRHNRGDRRESYRHEDRDGYHYR